MSDEIAQKYADETNQALEDVVERWDGHPELIAEDLFQTYSFEKEEMADLELFYPYQPKLLHAYFFSDSKIKNVYKGRRIGVSFIFCLAMLIHGIKQPDSFFPIVSVRKDSSESRINDIRTLIKNAKVDIPLETDNKGELVLWNGSTFRAYTGNPEGARGDDSATTVFVDEMAFLEDQEATMQAFMPFISLGKSSQMLQVSTPKVSNDLFMTTHDRGTDTGYDENGEPISVISVKQPSFKNPDDIDIEVPLYEQDVEPVRPDMDINAVEAERAQDPMGFAQEYLCRPISDEYRFFSQDSIEQAMSEGEAYYGQENIGRTKPLVAGVDFGTSSDETVVSVFEHTGNRERKLRYWEVINKEALWKAGVPEPDRANPNHISQRLKQLKGRLGIDHFVMDATGMGEVFEAAIREAIGRGVHGFNFSDKDGVKQMMGDLNYGLRNGLVTLVEDDRMFDQLSSIVKEQKEDWQKPKFSGKDHSRDGKDDIAMSLMLAAYPCMLDTDKSTKMHTKDTSSSHAAEGATSVTTPKQKFREERAQPPPKAAFGSRSVQRSTGRQTYNTRHARRRI